MPTMMKFILRTTATTTLELRSPHFRLEIRVQKMRRVVVRAVISSVSNTQMISSQSKQRTDNNLLPEGRRLKRWCIRPRGTQ